MKEQTKTTSSENRRDRWRKHITKRLASIKSNATYIPAAWLEEIEGRPMTDVICDWLANERGFDVKNPTPSQKYLAETDDYYETESTRLRNNHEREQAGFAVSIHLNRRVRYVKPRQLRQLIRRFYRAGDCGIDTAIARAVKCALTA